MKVPVDQIIIKEERFREDYGEVEELAVSIQRYGLFHPIIVDSSLNLIAGERRLKAHRMLGLKDIEVKQLSELDLLERREIEIEENLKRKNFNVKEEVKAIKEIDRIKRERYGSAVKGHGGGWSIRDTADSIGRSTGKVSEDMKIARMLEEFPELENEKTKEAIKKKYSRLRERQITQALADKVKVDIDTTCIVNGDSTVEMGRLESESVDLVFTDPPFAINLDKSRATGKDWERVYDDEYAHVLNTVGKVVKECYRVLRPQRHIYLWFGIQHYDYIHRLLTETGFIVNPIPCVWSKKGGAGAGASDYTYASNYEVCFLAMKGRRSLNRLGQSNVWEEPRLSPQRKVHPTEKPTSLIRRCIEQSSQPGELVIDPFAGSGSTLIAGLECKRKVWGCELDKGYYSQIVLKLEQMKEKEVRAAAKSQGVAGTDGEEV